LDKYPLTKASSSAKIRVVARGVLHPQSLQRGLSNCSTYFLSVCVASNVPCYAIKTGISLGETDSTSTIVTRS
jgi:hypothetical protein